MHHSGHGTDAATGATRMVFAVNSLAFLRSHRRALVEAALSQGWWVRIISGAPTDDRDQAALRDFMAIGASVVTIPLSRSSMSPLDLARTTVALRTAYAEAAPDLVHQVTPKIAICGSIAARLAGVPAVVTAISGLGFLFAGRSLITRGRALAAKILYGLALRHRNQVIIVQNERDHAILAPLVPRATPFVRFHGSGVDLERFAETPVPDGVPLVILPARMLRDKGVLDFAEAAKLLRSRGVRVRMALCGASDPGNPASLSESELQAIAAEGAVEYLGFQADMAPVLRSSAVVCLPSAYGEGLPLALAEAAAIGRAIITTDTPGCRDCVIDGASGILIPPHEPRAIADAIERLVTDHAELQRMGRASRALALERFSLKQVVAGHLSIYRDLTGT